MFFLGCRNAAAHVESCTGLACTRYVIELAFDGHHRCGFDVPGFDALGFAFGIHHVPRPVDQFELLEHRLDGFQIVVSVHVQHGVVLVIELAVHFSAGVVAFDQIFEKVKMAFGMVAGIHGHKPRVLQKAWVDTSTRPGEIAWHAVDDVVLKPFVRLGGGQIIHGGGGQPRINGATHHGHRQGCGFAPRSHQ